MAYKMNGDVSAWRARSRNGGRGMQSIPLKTHRIKALSATKCVSCTHREGKDIEKETWRGEGKKQWEKSGFNLDELSAEDGPMNRCFLPVLTRTRGLAAFPGEESESCEERCHSVPPNEWWRSQERRYPGKNVEGQWLENTLWSKPCISDRRDQW